LSSKCTRLGDHHLGAGAARLAADLLDGLHDIHAGGDPSENYVLAVQPSSLGGAKEELASVGVGASIGHGENTGSGVLQDEVFVGEFVAVDGLASGSVTSGEVTTLAHESRNNAMESRFLVAEPLFAGAESTEVLARLGADVRVERHDDTARGASADLHIKEDVLFRHFQVR